LEAVEDAKKAVERSRYSTVALDALGTLIKKKIKFSSYIGWSSCKVIYEEGLPNI
jgi:hypothetical protein